MVSGISLILSFMENKMGETEKLVKIKKGKWTKINRGWIFNNLYLNLKESSRELFNNLHLNLKENCKENFWCNFDKSPKYLLNHMLLPML